MYETLTFNLANAPIRRAQLQGKNYIVAPVAMLTEGVHAGSNGPLLYRESECKKAIPAWNMKPIVVYHPQMNGQGISACDPDVLEKQQVGMIMNTGWRGKLRCEAWIDEARAAQVDNRVIEALENNKVMEVSTGLFTDNVGEPGEWNGKPYSAEATNHQPDHLALLPDKIGACSVADGAGLLQLNEAATDAGFDATRLLVREFDVLRKMVGNALSFSDIQAAVRTAVKGVAGEDAYIVDVFEKYAIYEVGMDGKLFKLGYSRKGKSADIEIVGSPEEVIRVTEYKSVAPKMNAAPVDKALSNNQKEKRRMTKEALVQSLIDNVATKWADGDREILMNMDESVLEKLTPVDVAATETPVENAAPVAPAQVTVEQYIGQAPAEFRAVLINAQNVYAAQKAELIAKITANERNQFTPAFLATKDVDELRGIAALAVVSAPVVQNEAPAPMFVGAATLASAPVLNAQSEGMLPLPAMSFTD